MTKENIISGTNIVVGVLALQGAFAKHIEMLQKCGVNAIDVRSSAEIDKVDGLVIPGGESTTVGKLMLRYGIGDKIIDRFHNRMPIFGTCTGMILLANEIENSNQYRLGILNAKIIRNAFGRQIDSFETKLAVSEIGKPDFPAVFIRAPFVENITDNVRVMASYNEKIVCVRQDNILGCAFHPELTDDCRIHRYFISMIDEYLSSNNRYQENTGDI